MSSKSKTLALVLIVIGLTSLLLLQHTSVEAQTINTSAPAIEWQKDYGSQVNSASNLIQTVDGGYAFMDLGYGVTGWFKPSILFKVASNGTIQWNKTIADFFTGSQLIQTDDKGFEISGWWNAYRFGGEYVTIPTIINTDFNGDIQQIRNYTALPNLGMNSSKQMFPFEHKKSGCLQTRDDGFAYWTDGNITKTDPSNNTQWTKTLTYPTIDAYPTYAYPLRITSVIQTSHGELAALGVGYDLLDNDYTGKIYLIKTVAFLPLSSPTQLPTAIPPTTIPSSTGGLIFNLAIPIVAIVFLVVVVIAVLLLRRHRKMDVQKHRLNRLKT